MWTGFLLIWRLLKLSNLFFLSLFDSIPSGSCLTECGKKRYYSQLFPKFVEHNRANGYSEEVKIDLSNVLIMQHWNIYSAAVSVLHELQSSPVIKTLGISTFA